MQLTKERAITLHRRIWRWIGLKTLKEKRCVKKDEWFKRFKLNAICCVCYCCEYAYKNAHKEGKRSGCDSCPIDWGGISCMHYKEFEDGDNGLYSLWEMTVRHNEYKEAGKLALQIAELPEREEI